MNREEVSARSKLLQYMSGSHYLRLRDKTQTGVVSLAAKIFSLQPVGIVEMAKAVQSLGKAERTKRRKAFLAGLRKVEDREVLPPLGYVPKSAVPKIALSCRPQNQRPKKPPRADEVAIRNFYDSWEWKRLSFDVKLERGRVCECCGARPPEVRIITDHIKPIRHYWHLRLDKNNLQVLCDDCNKGKGSRHETDFRIGLSASGPRQPPMREIWDR